jgi:hypothetical protein
MIYEEWDCTPRLVSRPSTCADTMYSMHILRICMHGLPAYVQSPLCTLQHQNHEPTDQIQ